MSDEFFSEERKASAQSSTTIGTAEAEPAACPLQGRGWFKGAVAMAVCCAAPLLLFGAIAFFGLSLGAIASGLLSIVALLACPVGMFLMMRMIMNKKE